MTFKNNINRKIINRYEIMKAVTQVVFKQATVKTLKLL